MCLSSVLSPYQFHSFPYITIDHSNKNNRMCRIDLWLIWFGCFFVKCVMKPMIWMTNWRKSKKLPPIRSPLLYHSATTLARMIRSGKITSEEIIRAYIERVKEVNPLTNSMMDNRFEAALLDARYVDRVIQSGTKTEQEIEAETPFLGVPVTIKESIAVKGMRHSAGELRFAGRRASEDAETVKLLRAAGAIPLLVSSTPELCMMTETFNKIIGTTNNPYDLRRTPAGSSGGEASLISSAASVIGLGSDVAGSLRLPASFTGIFSHKPTPGVVSHAGHNPTSPDENWYRYFTIGPMARYAEDLPIMLKVLSNKNAERLRLNEKINIKNLKFYYMEDDGGSIVTNKVSREVRSAMQKVVAYLEKTHGVTPIKVDIKEMKEAIDLSIPILVQINGVTSLHRTDEHPKPWRTLLSEIFKFCFCLSETTLPPIIYSVLKRASLWIPEGRLQRLKEKNASVRKEFYEMLGDDGVFLYPTFVDTAHYHNEFYHKMLDIQYTMVFNALEVPVSNCPVGLSKNGLPIGIQVVGAPYQDRLTLAVAKEMEDAFGGWTEPPSTEKIA